MNLQICRRIDSGNLDIGDLGERFRLYESLRTGSCAAAPPHTGLDLWRTG